MTIDVQSPKLFLPFQPKSTQNLTISLQNHFTDLYKFFIPFTIHDRNQNFTVDCAQIVKFVLTLIENHPEFAIC